MRDIASVVGLKVISSKEGRELGAVSQVIVDLASGEVQGVVIGKGAAEKGVLAGDITVFGADAVMVDTHKVAKHLSDVPALLEKRRDPREGAREVITESGRRIGVLGTIYINPTTKKVTRYEVSGGAWRDITEGVLSLPPVEGAVDGKDTLVIPDKALGGKTDGAGGLRAQLARLAEVARTQTHQVNEKLEKGISAVGEKAKEAADELQKTEAGNAIPVPDEGSKGGEQAENE